MNSPNLSKDSRVLHGTRGLKPTDIGNRALPILPSRPSRDAWIETTNAVDTELPDGMSRPSRDAWIETGVALYSTDQTTVASFTGRVD